MSRSEGVLSMLGYPVPIGDITAQFFSVMLLMVIGAKRCDSFITFSQAYFFNHVCSRAKAQKILNCHLNDIRMPVPGPEFNSIQCLMSHPWFGAQDLCKPCCSNHMIDILQAVIDAGCNKNERGNSSGPELEFGYPAKCLAHQLSGKGEQKCKTKNRESSSNAKKAR